MFNSVSGWFRREPNLQKCKRRKRMDGSCFLEVKAPVKLGFLINSQVSNAWIKHVRLIVSIHCANYRVRAVFVGATAAERIWGNVLMLYRSTESAPYGIPSNDL
jgi:hypothetical protein